jgi:transposase
MANRLKMAILEAILRLQQQGWSQRRIARELGIDRDAVARHIREAQAGSKPANASPGSVAVSEDSKPANAPSGSAESAAQPLLTPAAARGPRPSDCEPWRSQIEAKLAAELSAQRIFQDLVSEHGFAGSYYSVRRFVRRLEGRRELPFRRLECGPGEEAQVDFGTGAPVLQPDGKRRRPHVFRLVLSYSRKAYSEAVYRQTTENFIRCLENAFWHLGGVPKVVVPDNLRAAVTTPDWFDPELNPKVRSFCQHYGVAMLPTRPRMARHKGKIERGIGYVKNNALRGRIFASLDEQNRFLADWEESVADTRIHGTTRRQVGKQFVEVERPALQPLPIERFPFFDEGQRTVNRDGHIEVAKAYYSLPPEYLGRTVWVRWDSRLVRVFDPHMKQITVHVRREPGRFSTRDDHIAPEKVCVIERGAAWMLLKAGRIGSHATRWAEALLQDRGIEGVRVLQGLLSLTRRHDSKAIDQACAVALSYGSYRLKTLRVLIGRQAPQQEQLAFLDEHPLIRSLSEYARMLYPESSFQEMPR